MARFFYVKSGFGTLAPQSATPFTSKQSGSFDSLGAANVYDSFLDLPSLIAGDIVFASHLHDKSYSGTTTYKLAGTDGFSYAYSVNDLSCNEYKKGATETVTTGNLTAFSGGLRDHHAYAGLRFVSLTGNIVLSPYHNILGYFECDIIASGYVDFGSRATKATFYNCNISCAYIVGAVSDLVFNRGSISVSLYVNGHSNAKYIGVDLSGSSSGVSLVGGNGIGAAPNILFYKCKMPLNYAGIRAATYNYLTEIKVIQCDNNVKYEKYTRYAEIALTSDVFLNESSYRFSSLSEISTLYPAYDDIVKLHDIDLSQGDTTLRVNLLLDTNTSVSLTDADFWLECSFNNNIEEGFNDFVSTLSIDILNGTSLQASSEAWQGTLPVNTQAYYVDVVIPQQVNITSADVILTANLSTPNTDIYIDSVPLIGT